MKTAKGTTFDLSKPAKSNICMILDNNGRQVMDLNVNFFTNENNPYMMSMEISDDVSNSMVFHFTRMAETQNQAPHTDPKNWHLNPSVMPKNERNMNVFLTKGYDSEGNEVPLLIAYSIIEENHNGVKILHEYDFRVFGKHSESVEDDVMGEIKKREFPIFLGSGRKTEVVFNA